MKTDIVARIEKSDKRVLDAAEQMVRTAAKLGLTVFEFERAVEAAKKSAVITTDR